MIAVIVAGGSGTRLWPLSTPEYPKHLLKISGDQSLLQVAFERAKRLSGSLEKIYVITEVGHAHHVREQLPELPEGAFIVEPGRRGTAGCMLAAMYKVHAQHAPDEPTAILWADHCIRDVAGFMQSFRMAGDASQKYNRPVLIGVEPTYPSTGFGYIHKAEAADGEMMVYQVAEFREKPELGVAQELFHSGEYLWNSGYIVTTLQAFEDAAREFCPELWDNYQKLLATQTEDEYKDAYLSFESTALDYLFNEKVKGLLVVPATFDWLDVGSFKDMYDWLDHNDQGNVIQGDKIGLSEVENCLVRNDEDKPVAVIGLNNVAVVNTPNGLLVTRTDLAQNVKEVSKQFQERGDK
jgi:mannose-1-phosphate guanylyltransferase